MNIMEKYPKYALSECMEINPCVLQDIGPLGPLPIKLKNAEKVNSRKSVRWSAVSDALPGVISRRSGVIAGQRPQRADVL